MWPSILLEKLSYTKVTENLLYLWCLVAKKLIVQYHWASLTGGSYRQQHPCYFCLLSTHSHHEICHGSFHLLVITAHNTIKQRRIVFALYNGLVILLWDHDVHHSVIERCVRGQHILNKMFNLTHATDCCSIHTYIFGIEFHL